MLAGRPYDASDPELTRERAAARGLLRLYNATADDEPQRRRELLEKLLASIGAGVWIEPPFFCDYGAQISVGERAYLNFGCVLLDCNRIEIGANVMIGPSVQIYAATHSTDPAERLAGLEFALPVTIGDNAWIGGAAVVGPGVTIGENTTIGAGSVVVADVPANVVAAGNPCRVVRTL
jgi:maltose O-acetyltransferase